MLKTPVPCVEQRLETPDGSSSTACGPDPTPYVPGGTQVAELLAH